MTVRPVRGRPTYIYGVDLIRFVAAVMVGLFHFTWLQSDVSTFAWYGWVGVEVFFVISGFVIAGSANNATPIKFLRSRLLRLYPAAWICATITLVVLLFLVEPTPDRLRRFAISLTLYYPFEPFPQGPFLATAYWTLPIEITFYALIFTVLVARQFHQIERVAVGLCVASSLYLVAYSLHCSGVIEFEGLEFNYFGWKNLTLLRHGVYFSTGILLWLWSEGLLSRLGRAAFVLGLAIAPLEITCRSAEILSKMPVKLDLLSVWWIPVIIWLLSCGLMAASAYWRAEVLRAPPMVLKVVRFAGLATYPLYLVHEELGKATRNFLIELGFSQLGGAFAGLGLVTVTALVIACVGEPALRTVLGGGLTAIGARFAPNGWLLRLYRPGGSLIRSLH